jgi:SAM-dependent methyltransferase
LKNGDEWRNWAKSDSKPDDIPRDPRRVYKGKGWLGMGDWLGTGTVANQNRIYLPFEEARIYVRKSIEELCSSPNPESDFEKIVTEIDEQNAALENEELADDEEIAPDVVPTEEETTDELPTLRSFAALKAVDLLVDAGITSDEETLEFLVCNRVSELWQACLNNDPKFDLDRLRTETGGVYFKEIRNRFLSQYDGAINLSIPVGYNFQKDKDGVLTLPSLMQRLTAYRVLTERRVGNWSGVGAGKTISAILTSRVIDARLTIIIAFNSTVETWQKVITDVYPDSIVIVKERGDIQVNPEKHTYLILNFETFQQASSDKMARQLVDNHQIDFIVLDEIQNVKQRTSKVESKRRQVVNGLLCEASLQWKKTLADAAVDGVIPEGGLASPETMKKKANEALQAWISRVETDGVFVFERTQLEVPLPEFETQIALRRFGDFSLMNSRFNSAYSQTTHERLKQNPEEWYLYHTLYREARQNWSEIPYQKIAKSLEKRPDWVIGDFGCGEAKLAECLPNKVYSFDHIAINEDVIACDIAHTPLKDGQLDVAIFSLSLMGINYPDYLKEAYRVLKFGGLLKIAEPINRWFEKKPELLAQITSAGFLTIGNVEESNQFLYINAIKPLR